MPLLWYRGRGASRSGLSTPGEKIWAGLAARVRNPENAYRMFIGNPQWKGKEFGEPRRRCKDNAKCFSINRL
jgi:hypothetical protein